MLTIYVISLTGGHEEYAQSWYVPERSSQLPHHTSDRKGCREVKETSQGRTNVEVFLPYMVHNSCWSVSHLVAQLDNCVIKCTLKAYSQWAFAFAIAISLTNGCHWFLWCYSHAATPNVIGHCEWAFNSGLTISTAHYPFGRQLFQHN